MRERNALQVVFSFEAIRSMCPRVCMNRFHDSISPRVVTTCGDLFNAEAMAHRRYESAHEFRCIIAPEFEGDSFNEDESREQSS